MELSRGRLEKYGVDIPPELRSKIDSMRHVRNVAAHGHGEPTRDDVINTIKTIESVEQHLASLDISKIKAAATEDRMRYEAERKELLKMREQNLLLARQQQALELGVSGSLTQ